MLAEESVELASLEPMDVASNRYMILAQIIPTLTLKVRKCWWL